MDVIGTLVIILGVIGVVVFGSKRENGAFDTESNLTLSLLKELWGRKEWIIFIVLMELGVGGMFWVSGIVDEVREGKVEDDRGDAEGDRGIQGMTGGRRTALSATPSLLDRARHYFAYLQHFISLSRSFLKTRLEHWAQSSSDIAVRKLAGLSYAITGGMYAGITLILAKSFVKMVSSAMKNDPLEPNQFSSPLSWLIVVMLVTAGIAQICESSFSRCFLANAHAVVDCLNASLKCYDSTFTVPIFFATSVSSFLFSSGIN